MLSSAWFGNNISILCQARICSGYIFCYLILLCLAMYYMLNAVDLNQQEQRRYIASSQTISHIYAE